MQLVKVAVSVAATILVVAVFQAGVAECQRRGFQNSIITNYDGPRAFIVTNGSSSMNYTELANFMMQFMMMQQQMGPRGPPPFGGPHGRGGPRGGPHGMGPRHFGFPPQRQEEQKPWWQKPPFFDPFQGMNPFNNQDNQPNNNNNNNNNRQQDRPNNQESTTMPPSADDELNRTSRRA